MMCTHCRQELDEISSVQQSTQESGRCRCTLSCSHSTVTCGDCVRFACLLTLFTQRASNQQMSRRGLAMILKEPHGSNDQPPLDIDLMINRAILNEDDFACSACSWLFVRRLLRRGGLSSQEQGKVGLTPVAHIASKTAQQDGTSQPDVVSAGSHCSMNGRALQNWTQLILRVPRPNDCDASMQSLIKHGRGFNRFQAGQEDADVAR